MSNVSNYRLPMPLVDVDQAFSTVAELEVVLTTLHKRAVWFLSTRSAAEVDEEYEGLGAYVWTVKTDDEFTAHFELAERRHAVSAIPEDALCVPFAGTWSLRDVEAVIKTNNWKAAFLVIGTDYFLGKFTGGSLH